MDHKSDFFEIERSGDILLLTPTTDMGELDHERIDVAMKAVFEMLADVGIKNIVLDFHRTDYFGSTALGFFVRLWKTVSGRQGSMAFCNLSEHEAEILKVTKLDQLWEIRKSKEEALRVVRPK